MLFQVLKAVLLRLGGITGWVMCVPPRARCRGAMLPWPTKTELQTAPTQPIESGLQVLDESWVSWHSGHSFMEMQWI